MNAAIVFRLLMAGTIDLFVLLISLAFALPRFACDNLPTGAGLLIPAIANSLLFFQGVSIGRLIAKPQKGGSFFILMWAIVFMLVLFAAPFNHCEGRAQSFKVKRHMYELQTQLEIYAQNHGGQYPSALPPLQKKAFFGLVLSEGLETDNPFKPELPSYQIWQGEQKPGVVYYAPVQTPKGLTGYQIYGMDKAGQPLFDKGRALILSNQ